MDERVQKTKRAKDWNGHVREAVRTGNKRRAQCILTAVVWTLLIGAVGWMTWQFCAQQGRLKTLLQEEQRARAETAQEEAQRAALQDQVTRLAQDNDALRTQLEAAKEETQTAQTAVEAARQALADLEAEARTQPPQVIGPAYTTLYPELYASSSQRETLVPANTVYLTFDDGPSALTAEVLDILKENDIRATFFVTGQTSELAQEMMKRIVAEGHTIAVHTYSHDYHEIYASVEAYLADFEKIYNWVYEVTGVYPQIFRFPGGTINSFNGAIWRELVAEMDRRGFVHYDWNASCGDADGLKHTPEELAQNALSRVGVNRVIVLMHDSAVREATVASLPAVVEGYRNAGYTFAPLTPEVKSITFD